MQHYTDDPLMDGPRRIHGLILEPVGTTKTFFGADAHLYGAACRAGDWMDARPYDDQAHAEGFDQHMADVQQKVHETEAATSGQDDRPDQEA
ncbi:hypothetical protein ACWDZ4_20355 [Streptomyces sp. NPDC003016]